MSSKIISDHSFCGDRKKMNTRVFKFDNPDSSVFEVVEIISDNQTDPLTHFVPPFGFPEIIFYFNQTHQIKNTSCANGFIKGQYSIAQKIDFIPGYHFLAIRLHPFGLKQLFNINASDLLNAVIDIKEHPVTYDIWKYLSQRKFVDAPFIKNLLIFIDQFAIYPVSNSTKEFINLSKGSEIKSIKGIIKNTGIGLRTLQRNFKKEVGLTPKEFLRIMRMNAIEQQLPKAESVFQIIADYDLADQAHLSKEFKKLRNFPPNEFIKRKLLLSDQLPDPKLIKL